VRRRAEQSAETIAVGPTDHPVHAPRSSGATPEEAAAIAAALERFRRETSLPPARLAAPADGWRRAAILEGVAREDLGDVPDPWIIS
jgi:hypothetical protein